MKYTLIILFTFLAVSTALVCQQCTGPVHECNGIEDNGIEVDCNYPDDLNQGNVCYYYRSRPIFGKSIN